MSVLAQLSSSGSKIATKQERGRPPAQHFINNGSRGVSGRGRQGQCCYVRSLPSIAAVAAVDKGPDLDLKKMEPVGDRILVKPAEESSTTESGLIVSPTGSAGSMGMQDAVVGEVLAVGDAVDIKVVKGDKIVYSKYSTSDVSVPGGDVTFVAQKSVLATLS